MLRPLIVLQWTPQQENGYDCGVFTCQFLESLSRGEESFIFTQKDMPYLRRRMIWEIGHAILREDWYIIIHIQHTYLIPSERDILIFYFAVDW